jgi:S-adenosylmethionine:diacylglycerol 3-amino-3-carboxypropyl transferase
MLELENAYADVEAMQVQQKHNLMLLVSGACQLLVSATT